MTLLKLNLFLSTLAISTLMIPAVALATVQSEAQALEAEMNQVKADIQTTDVKSANRQFQIVVKASRFVHNALSSKKVDDQTIAIVARILVRNYFYDQAGDLAADNYKLIEKYSTRLDKALNQLEKQKVYDHDTLEAVRLTVGIAGNVRENGNDPQGKNQPVGKPKALKKDALQNDGAQLTTCDLGACTHAKSSFSLLRIFHIPGA